MLIFVNVGPPSPTPLIEQNLKLTMNKNNIKLIIIFKTADEMNIVCLDCARLTKAVSHRADPK